jgi:Kef-type K+ transport system membrane component KefB
VENTILSSIFMIFLGSSILGTLAMFTRQSLMVVYMLVGVVIGPWGLNLALDSLIIKEVGEVGIIVLLFLLGLHLDPHSLINGAKKTAIPTLVSSAFFAFVGYEVAVYSGFTDLVAYVIALSMMFSSTIICLKLLPSNALHHSVIGENMISVLLIQDVLAILVLIVLKAAGSDEAMDLKAIGYIVMGSFSILAMSFVGEKLVIVPLFQRFEKNREYLFLVALGWCFSMSDLAHHFNLSHEIGAFIAGVSIASASSVSLYLAECLKPLRDFFLVLFFFSIGVQFNLTLLPRMYPSILILATLMILLKPVIFRYLFVAAGDQVSESWELGVRLGQVSEFSILVSEIAEQSSVIGPDAAFLIKGTTIVTFLVSSLLVTRRYKTPVGEAG